MIKWADKLYLSKDIGSNRMKKIIKAIENGHLTFEVYCITFASNPNNLFDIINANEFLFSYYSRKELYVLGLATSKEEAKLLVKDMLTRVYTVSGEFKVREFFLNELYA